MAPSPLFIRQRNPKVCAVRSTIMHAGQAQREFFVNESLARLDLLIQPAVVGEIGNPPEEPEEGQCFLIAETAGGIWTGLDGNIAGWIAGEWVNAVPSEGMQLHDLSTSTMLTYKGGWQRSTPIAEPSGGNTIDAEARSAIAALIATMRQHGVF